MCCSQYGWCGTTTGHCGTGCQAGFGICSASPTASPSPAPSSSPYPTWPSTPPPIDPAKRAPWITTCTRPGLFALTFDDGPTSITGNLLDVLKANNIKATFFVNARNWGDISIEPYRGYLLRAYTEGHQIASHTQTHADLTTLSTQGMWDQMRLNDDAIARVIGKRPVYMRPPYGASNNAVLNALGSWGYRVIWLNVDSKDYEHTGQPNAIQQDEYNYSLGLAGLSIPQTSLITLQHDHVIETVNAWTKIVIDRYTAIGYRFVTVGECLGDTPDKWYR
ncbi:hypothetical protein BC831DRAFT_470392 [Entophlyctis helioformis]|nr:hypothetical protein BC831DRAFT_470392 [Entophlyctis helioformis]